MKSHEESESEVFIVLSILEYKLVLIRPTSRSLGVPENSAFVDVEKILKIIHVKNKFWKNSEESDFKNYVF